MQSTYFSDFHDLIKKWEDHLKYENKILDELQKHQLILFFKYDGKVYGATEDNRLTFARMKSGDEPEDWKADAKFGAIDIESLKSEKSEHLFTMKDLNKIKLADRDDIISKLSKQK